ncbi:MULTISPECIES: DUF58 domain-containing protein [unclassified Hyphomonas]|uniref:DUF58 domain-containing protein n=1 Tax=unclassified Hyphomonas TaxID=2630699 RepID=UPI000C8E8FF6|nr:MULTISPECIES: DUF58 domain-containing protein [unclassified Hyphomonas]MAL44116.1 DUF58 domain-containing protein [Hyphomonas sp.]HBN92286.1 DUF58 domain-containing protein [Hyphomonas sp.]HBT38459.1 DUF58 domain-containing protein [Hyphomonas sp.]HBU33580.1 DUF58 domain-containing protein [Hyphomonas sp.]
MISPTPRAIFLMLLGVPLMVAIALLRPELWVISAGWVGGIASLIFADAVLAASLRAYEADVDAPALLYVGGSDPADLTLRFARGPLPRRIEVLLEVNAFLQTIPPAGLRGWQDRARSYSLPLTPTRRGLAKLVKLWSRWKGPLGLIQKQHTTVLDRDIPITPNIRWVKDEAIRIYSRDAEFGVKMQIERGDGSEFDALREFTTGMDRRAIDWKHSARHRNLLAKEFRTERNHNIVFAFDTGRLMSEPLGGVPKIDRAINAGLLLSFVSLRSGDRAMIYGFDAKPGFMSGFMSGQRSFTKAQDLAAQLDYSAEEANFTLALSSLASKLERRSLIIIFSDFVDTISAELMLENVKRLTDRHLVIFATFEDESLAEMVDAPPSSTESVTRAVIADTLMAERDTVLLRLQRMGVQVIETRPEQFGAELISRYLQIKQRDML